MIARLRITILALLVAVATAVGVGTVPASANAPGNYAQPWTYFACARDVVGPGADIKGSIAVHYQHDSSHRDRAYGTYIVLDHLSGFATGSVQVDTDVRYPGSSTWHYQSTNYLNAANGYSAGWLFDYPASWDANGGYARWQITWEMSASGETFTRTCQVPGSGTLSGSWSTGALFGAP